MNGLWISEALIYTTSQGRIKSWCGGRVELIYHINAAAGGAGAGRAGSSFLLGYVAEQNRLYLIDRDLGLSACTLHAAFIDYKVKTFPPFFFASSTAHGGRGGGGFFASRSANWGE